MEAEYRREMNENRIWLTMPSADEQAEAAGRWQFRMLQENRLQGILPVVSMVENGRRRFGYEISTYTPLTEYLPAHRAELPFIRDLLWQIQETALLLEDYMLSPDLLVLDPACVFTDERGRFYFCLLPCWDTPLKTGLRNLLRGLLDYLNYENREETIRIYGLYRLTTGRNYRLEDLFSYMREDQPADEPLPADEDLPPWEDAPVRETLDNAGLQETTPKKENSLLYWLMLAMGLTLICGIGWMIFREPESQGGMMLQCAAVILGEAAGGALLYLHRDELRSEKKRGRKAELILFVCLLAAAPGVSARAAQETKTLPPDKPAEGYFMLEVTGAHTGEEADLEGIEYEIFRDGSSEPLGTVTISEAGLGVLQSGLPLEDGPYYLKMKKPSPGIVYSAAKIRVSPEAENDAEHPLIVPASVEEKQGRVRMFLDESASAAKDEEIRLLVWDGSDYAVDRVFTAEEANEGAGLIWTRQNRGRFALQVGDVYEQEFLLEAAGETVTFLLGGVAVPETAALPESTAAPENETSPETSTVPETETSAESSTAPAAEPDPPQPGAESAAVSAPSILLFLSLAMLYAAVITCGGKTVFGKKR